MRVFGSNTYLLRDARLEVRLIYTGFLILVVLGMLTMAAFQLWHIGPTPARIVAYYCGGERAGEMTFPKTFRELVEVTHFHAFIMAVVYLVLAHLFIATTVSPGLKQACIVVAFAGLAGGIAAPWLVRYGSPVFAYLQLVAWGAEWLGFAAFVCAPIGEMWFSHERGEFPPE